MECWTGLESKLDRSREGVGKSPQEFGKLLWWNYMRKPEGQEVQARLGYQNLFQREEVWILQGLGYDY